MSISAPVAMTAATQTIELVPDAMSGLTLAPDFLVKRIVGSFTIGPQAASTASSVVGLAIVRSTHSVAGAVETIVDPLGTDVDMGSKDILWQKQWQPNFGAPLDATALDLAMTIDIDLKSRTSLRRLDKRHGIQLVHRVDTDARLQLSFKLRVLGALAI